jgi:hypothetical protein
MPDDIEDIAHRKGVIPSAYQHKAHFSSDKYHHREEIELD